MKPTKAAVKTAVASLGATPAIRIVRVEMLSGTGFTAEGTAAIIAVTANASGISSMARCIAAPMPPPTKSSGTIGPPTNPNDGAPVVATIFAISPSTKPATVHRTMGRSASGAAACGQGRLVRSVAATRAAGALARPALGPDVMVLADEPQRPRRLGGEHEDEEPGAQIDVAASQA